MADAVRYLPCLGSAAHIMFLASHICWVSSGTVKDLYCCEPLDVRGANPTMKKCRRGNGIRFTASFRRSEFSCPGNRRQQVTPLIVALMRWFRSPTESHCKDQSEKSDVKRTASRDRDAKGKQRVNTLGLLTCGSDQFQCSEADVVKRLIVEDHTLVRILHKLMDRERRVVGLHNSVGYFGGRKHWKREHHSVWILLPDLGDQQCSHPGSSTSSQWVAYLKPCKTKYGLTQCHKNGQQTKAEVFFS